MNVGRPMNIISLLQTFKAIVHTFVRFLPLGMYSFSYFLAALYKDKRGAILLLGLLVNDVIGFLYKHYFNYIPNDNCAIFGRKNDGSALGFLPNAHVEVVAFLLAYVYSNMWDEYKFDLIPFVFMAALLGVTAWSRVTIGCSKVKDVIFNVVVGLVIGMLFYYFTGKYYNEAKKGLFEKETCDLGYNNYKCNEIKDGTVILKQPEDTRPKTDDEKKDEAYQGWYD